MKRWIKGLGPLAITLVLVSCGKTTDTVTGANTAGNPVAPVTTGPANVFGTNGALGTGYFGANPWANNPYFYNGFGPNNFANSWGTRGVVQGGVLYVYDIWGNVSFQTTRFQLMGGAFATYWAADGIQRSVSLQGPTFPYVNSGYFNNAWAWNQGFFYYPYYYQNTNCYFVALGCYQNYSTYSWGGHTYMYLTGAMEMNWLLNRGSRFRLPYYNRHRRGDHLLELDFGLDIFGLSTDLYLGLL